MCFPVFPYPGKCENNVCADTSVKLDGDRPPSPKLSVVDGPVGLQRFRAFSLHARAPVCAKISFEFWGAGGRRPTRPRVCAGVIFALTGTLIQTKMDIAFKVSCDMCDRHGTNNSARGSKCKLQGGWGLHGQAPWLETVRRADRQAE